MLSAKYICTRLLFKVALHYACAYIHTPCLHYTSHWIVVTRADPKYGSVNSTISIGTLSPKKSHETISTFESIAGYMYMYIYL